MTLTYLWRLQTHSLPRLNLAEAWARRNSLLCISYKHRRLPGHNPILTGPREIHHFVSATNTQMANYFVQYNEGKMKEQKLFKFKSLPSLFGLLTVNLCPYTDSS